MHCTKVLETNRGGPLGLEVITQGYKPILQSLPPLTRLPLWFTVSDDKHPALQQEISDLSTKGAIEIVQDHQFLFQDISGSQEKRQLRPVIDLSPLNKFLVIPRFKMLTTRHLAHLMPQKGYAASLDLADAYFHVPIRKSFRKYLRFAYNGTVWQFKCLPFGISTAPYVFTKLAVQLATFLQQFAIPLHQFIDDWLTQAHSMSRTSLHMLIILHITRALAVITEITGNSGQKALQQRFSFLPSCSAHLNF